MKENIMQSPEDLKAIQEKHMTEGEIKMSEEREATFTAGEKSAQHNLLEDKINSFKKIFEGENYYYRIYRFKLKNNEDLTLRGKFTIEDDKIVSRAEGYGSSEKDNRVIPISEITRITEKVQDSLNNTTNDNVVFADSATEWVVKKQENELKRIKFKGKLEKIKAENHIASIKTINGGDYRGYINEVLEDGVKITYKNYGPTFMSTDKIDFDEIERVADSGPGRAGHDYL